MLLRPVDCPKLDFSAAFSCRPAGASRNLQYLEKWPFSQLAFVILSLRKQLCACIHLCTCVHAFIRAGALTVGQGNDVVLRTLACEREKTAVRTHTHTHMQSKHKLMRYILNFTPFSIYSSICLSICLYVRICVCLACYLSPYLFLSVSFSSCLSCVHNTPLKAGLHVLASDWLRSKKMMSFLVGRCISFHIHTHTDTQRGERIEGRDPGS